MMWRGVGGGAGAATSRGNLTLSNANVFGFSPSILDLLSADKVLLSNSFLPFYVTNNLISLLTTKHNVNRNTKYIRLIKLTEIC